MSTCEHCPSPATLRWVWRKLDLCEGCFTWGLAYDVAHGVQFPRGSRVKVWRKGAPEVSWVSCPPLEG